MRPDEHKKKKNAQYKKKHGVPDKENKTDAKSKSNFQDMSQKSLNEKENDSTEVQRVDKKIKDKVKVEETEEVNKHYGRRKLQSNWSRYEEDSGSEAENDIPLQRGEDFNKLLAEAGGSATQFRLRDEEEWNIESQSSTATTVLALDFENLSQSLDCIPLHERLGIDSQVFTEEQLNEIKAYSSEREKKYGAATREMPNLIKTDGKMEVVNKSQKSSSDSTVRKPFPSAVENNDSKRTCDVQVQNKPETVDKAKTKGDYVEDKSEDMQKNKGSGKYTKNSEVESLEDDLDTILSLEETDGKTAESVNKVDRIIDKNLNMKTAKIKNEDMEYDSKVKEKKSEAKGNENLEDWLDSMLDD